jgi:hypothetical protein
VPWIVPFLPDFTQGGHAPSTATVGSYEQRIKVPLPPPQRVLDLDNDVRVPGDARNPTNALHERPQPCLGRMELCSARSLCDGTRFAHMTVG